VADSLRGDLLYAFQALPFSFGAALLRKVRRRLPVVLDITDWEVWGAYRYGGGPRHMLHIARQVLGTGWLTPTSLKYHYLTDKLVPLADAVTVVATFLQKRYGGALLRHGPDTSVFDPGRYDPRALRDKWGLPQDQRLILFAGTPSAWKGADQILAALDLVPARDIRLVMAGKPFPLANDRVLHLGFQPHALIPELLAMADLVVLPQRNHPMAQAQIPNKVFEAMAMARPIVASGVGDMPEVLAGCGAVVEPENVPALAAAIQDMLSDRERAAELGRRAREKCVREYSWNAIERVLADVLRPFS
jgi:glycosyltransferase involved in cell wall biosynthesis